VRQIDAPGPGEAGAIFGMDEGEGERVQMAESVAEELRAGLAYWRGLWS
jgi:hypothetical protein